MLPFVDIHVHLLAGLDDGPRTAEDALSMCEMAVADGTGTVAALAHQGDGWPDVTPEQIRTASRELQQRLQERAIPLRVFPSAELLVNLDFEGDFAKGRFMTIGDRGRYALIELPMNCSMDPRPLVDFLIAREVVPILAHIERYPDLLYQEELVQQLIAMGCLIQVNASSITMPADRREEKVLRDWLRRNLIHFIASDGHSPRRRQPRLRDAHEVISRWTTPGIADRVCSIHGNIILNDLPWKPMSVLPKVNSSWFAKLFS